MSLMYGEDEVAYLLPELVHAPLRQLVPHFNGRLVYRLWCWLRTLEVCSLAGFTHAVSVRGEQKTSLIQESFISRFRGCFVRYIR